MNAVNKLVVTIHEELPRRRPSRYRAM
jgi:hypothetical protein